MRGFSKLAATVALLGVCSMVGAAPVTFQNGQTTPFIGGTYNGTQDTILFWSTDSNKNNGAYPALYSAGVNSHILIQFDVSALAGHGTVQSATLKLVQENSGQADATFTYSVYQLADANAGWQEGNKNYGNATAGDVTWDWKIYNTVGWAGAGPYDGGANDHGNRGASNAGVDYVATALATPTYVQKQDSSNNGTVHNISLPASLVTQWISGTNAGLIIISNGNMATNTARFGSSETYLGATYYPSLEVTMVPEPTAGILLLGAGVLAFGRRRRA
ncbi:MAG: PEP-CTERM sorting domain-containing protein [Phycisphaerales bacterium]|nr:PEP-CTERM sorting domain-containing protein [Phycisphaerales bacterium]